MNRDFKKGDWIITKWKDEDIVDIAMFDAYIFENEFLTDHFYRFEHPTIFESIHELGTADLTDERYEFNWRLMTEEEKEKYLRIIFPKD